MLNWPQFNFELPDLVMAKGQCMMLLLFARFEESCALYACNLPRYRSHSNHILNIYYWTWNGFPNNVDGWKQKSQSKIPTGTVYNISRDGWCLAVKSKTPVSSCLGFVRWTYLHPTITVYSGTLTQYRSL